MTRVLSVCLFATSLVAASAALAGADGTHLEVAAGVTPTFIQDPAYEAFSEDDLRAERLGLDLRVEVLKLGYFRLVPFLAYRGAKDGGAPYGVMDTRFGAHDFAAGLRVRTWFRSWVGAFLEAEGGVTYVKLDGELNGVDPDAPGMRDTYSDKTTTWLVGGLMGLEFRLPPAVLKRRGVEWLGFGLELGGGYLRRGEIDLDPALEGGDDNSLALADSADWGGMNLSGWVFQVMFTVSLF